VSGTQGAAQEALDHQPRSQRQPHQKAEGGGLGVSSDEDPSPEPSWSGDVASAAID
jgi:hypothetical protein